MAVVIKTMNFYGTMIELLHSLVTKKLLFYFSTFQDLSYFYFSKGLESVLLLLPIYFDFF